MIEKNTVLDDIEKIMDQKEDERLPAKLDSLKAYLALLLKFPLLSLEEEREITRLVYEDHDPCSAERLALSNLKLVVKISMGYNNMYHDILDLIQEGNVGLLHAIKKYNPYKGTKFSTYAQFWIRAYMMKFIMDTWSIVKLGTTQGQRKLFYRLNKERRRLEQLGLYPATRIIAQNLQVKEEEVKEMETGLAFNDVYLESPVSDEGSDTMMDLLADDEDVEYVVTEKEKQNVLAKIIKTFTATLNEKEECVLHKRLMADEPLTLEEIGMKFRISRERERQIEREVLKKARTCFNRNIAKIGIMGLYAVVGMRQRPLQGKLDAASCANSCNVPWGQERTYLVKGGLS